MTEIVISGYYGFGNAGDEAMLAAMIEAFDDLDPQIRLTVISGNPEETRRRHGVEAVHRLNYAGVVRVLARSSLLISGGGSLLQDVTSNRSLYYYLSIVWLAKKMGKPVMLYAQGIGPVRGALAKAMMRRVGNRVDLITVRDEGSRDELRFLQVNKPPVHVTADPVLALHPVDKEIGRLILRRSGLEGAAPLIGISVREWRDWLHYKRVLAETADRLVTEMGARVVFIPMQSPDDVAAARKIVRNMKQKAVVLEEDYTTAELLSLVGNLDLLIAIRLHALIFSAVMRTPLIGISYDPKIDRFLETLKDRPAGTLQTMTAEAVITKVRELGLAVKKNRKHWEESISVLRAQAFHNAELALELLAKQR